MLEINKSDDMPAKQLAVLTTGEVIKMLRELKGWTQKELVKNETRGSDLHIDTFFSLQYSSL